ncbi:MAG: tRNA-specific 2-thiouridylase MnmA, partial [Candidatus Daviesbacteria bacterium GW2011_GWB1_41_5]
MQKTILLALSGGVDSSVAALLLKKQGYNVIAVFMKNFSDTKNPLTMECNYVEEKKMAQKMAAILNIPLIIMDLEKEYKRDIIKLMYNSYSKGLTPNPDILCNKIIKFPFLWKKAKSLKADFIATGHYARIKKTKLSYELLEGKDKTKDQSYFLSQLTQDDLSHTIFPLGELKKSEVRKIAKENKFPNHSKKSTSGICFIGKVNMKSFLEKKIKNKKGAILDENNNLIGRHPGIMYYTIGQRIGNRIGMEITNKINKKLYVAEKKKPNTIIAVPKDSPLLKKQIIKIKKLHLINPKEAIS